MCVCTVCVCMCVCIMCVCMCCVCVCVCVVYLIVYLLAAPKVYCSKVNCFRFGHASCLGFISHKLDQKESLFFCQECVSTLHEDSRKGIVVCLCVCVCVCVYVCVCVCMYICMYVCMFTLYLYRKAY